MNNRHKHKDLFGPGGCLTRHAIDLHIRGELDEHEERKVRRHAKRCGLCANALEGAMHFENGVRFNAALTKLDNSPWRKSFGTETKGRKIVVGLSSIAASLLLLFGVHYTLKMRDKIDRLSTLVSEEKVANIAVHDSLEKETELLSSPPAVPEKLKHVDKKQEQAPAVLKSKTTNNEMDPELQEKPISFEKDTSIERSQRTATAPSGSESELLYAPQLKEETITEVKSQPHTEKGKLENTDKPTDKKAKKRRKRLRKDKKTYVVAEVMPMFRGGGIDKFNAYLEDSLEVVLQDSVLKESVVVGFRINAAGKVDKVKLINGTASKELNKKIVQLITESPSWVPGTTNGIPVAVEQQLKLVINKSK